MSFPTSQSFTSLFSLLGGQGISSNKGNQARLRKEKVEDSHLSELTNYASKISIQLSPQ